MAMHAHADSSLHTLAARKAGRTARYRRHAPRAVAIGPSIGVDLGKGAAIEDHGRPRGSRPMFVLIRFIPGPFEARSVRFRTLSRIYYRVNEV